MGRFPSIGKNRAQDTEHCARRGSWARTLIVLSTLRHGYRMDKFRGKPSLKRVANSENGSLLEVPTDDHEPDGESVAQATWHTERGMTRDVRRTRIEHVDLGPGCVFLRSQAFHQRLCLHRGRRKYERIHFVQGRVILLAQHPPQPPGLRIVLVTVIPGHVLSHHG